MKKNKYYCVIFQPQSIHTTENGSELALIAFFMDGNRVLIVIN